MRKISTLLMLFCAFVGTALAQVTELSQLSNDKIYALKSGRCFLLYSEANVDKLSTSTATAITDDAERVEDAINNPNQQFKIQNTEGVYYLYSVGAAKYVTKDGSLSTDPVDALEIHDVRANFPNYPWKLCIGGNGVNTQVAGQMATGVTVNSWTSADAGNTFQIVDIEEKPLFDALTQLSTMVNNAKAELVNKHKLALQTTDANAPFYLSATVQGDAPISAAIDNNPATHYGSTWGSTVGHHHYWQVDLADAANLEEFTFSYITRANGSDTPTKINVQGSTDGEAFTDIVVLADGLPTAGGSTYLSAKIVNEGYRYIRFEVPSTTNNFSAAGNAEQEVTIAIAEFSLIDANVENYSVSDKNISNAISAAEVVLNASNNTLKTVQDAIDAFNAALVSGRCTVNYSFTYGGVERYTQTVETYVGEEYPEITVANQFVYGITAVKPTGVINADDVVDGQVTKVIELEVNLPFVPAADYESITKWYYLSIGNGAHLLYHQAGADHIALNNTEVDANNKDAYTWAFIGNPFDGFKIVNRATGDGYVLSSSTNTFDGNTGGNTYPIMTAEPVGDGKNTYWVATASPNRGGEGSFYLAQKDVNEGKNKMNNRGSKLAYWNGGADAGSTFKATERDMSGAVELQAYITQVEAFVAAGVTDGTTVGYITSESVANVAAVLAAAKTAVETKVGCNEAQVALQNAIAAVETVQPDVNAYYVIKSAMPEADARSGQMIYVNKQGWMHFHNENVMANVFQFASAGDGKFYLNHVETGSALSTAKEHGGGQEAAHTALWDVNPVAVTITNMGSKNIVKLVPDGGAMIHAQAAKSAVVGWDNNSYEGASAWIIEEVNIEDYAHNVTVTDAEWATLVLGYNAAIPEGVTAYAVSSVDAESATLTQVKGVLPANTPVLLNAPADDYAFVLSTETPAVVENNVLDGCTIDREVWEDCYVLGNGSAGVGFYKAKKNVNANTENDIVEGEGEEAVTTPTYEAVLSNAFKAFLVAPTNAQALRFNFGGTTAIESVVNGINANAAIYDLSGRRVEKATKGIYIVNGKKMIVK